MHEHINLKQSSDCFFSFYTGQINEFIIETKNILMICRSCRREFVMLDEYLNSIGKKVEVTVYSDDSIEKTADLKRKLKIRKNDIYGY